MSEAMEVMTFRLAKGLKVKDFIAANTDVDAWLKKQPGFILRRVCEGQGGWVIDMLLWKSEHYGQRAACIVTQMAGSPVHAAIDQSTVDWSIQECRHRLD